MNTAGLKDIHGPVSVPGEWWWLWIVLFLLCVAGVIAAWYFFLRKSACTSIKLIVIPPWEKALAALSSLEMQAPYISGGVKQYYFQLSGIIRLYIEERFNIRAPEMTTEEFMDQARASTELSTQHRLFLDNFLNVSDMVKFARFEPVAQDMVDVLMAARIFVEGTRPLIENESFDNVKDIPV